MGQRCGNQWQVMRRRRWSANLRRHAVTEVQDGDVVRVRSLIHTQIRPQAIPQLHEQKDETREDDIVNSESVSFALLANGHCFPGHPGAHLVFVHKAELLITLIHKGTVISPFLRQPVVVTN